MADVITRFKLETTQYDSKLRDAAKGLSEYARVAAFAGNEFDKFTKDQAEAARALGSISTSANNAKDKVRELVNAYNQAANAYNALTKEQQQSDWGRALAESINTLKGRITEAKQELYSMGDSAKNSGGIMDVLSQKFTVNIDALKLFNVGLSAAKAALDVAKDAFFASEANVDEWGHTMASAEALYSGFVTALNSSDFSSFLTQIDGIVQAAREAYNELDKLGTMRTIQAPGFAKQEAENQRLRLMIMTGKFIEAGDGRKSPIGLKNGDILSPEQIRTLERQLQNGMNKIVSLTKNELGQTGKAIDAYYNSLAKQNGMSIQEFRQGTSSWDAYQEKMRGYERYQKWRRENTFTDAWGNRQVREGNPYQEFKKWGVFRVDKMGTNSYNDLVGLIKQQQQQQQQMYSTLGQTYRTINRAEGFTVRNILNGGGGGKGGGGGSTNSETVAITGSIGDYTKQIQELRKLQSDVTDPTQWQAYQQAIDGVNEKINVLKGNLPKDSRAEFRFETITDDVMAKLREVEGVHISTKPVTITADTSEAMDALKNIEGIHIDPKTMVITADNTEALEKAKAINGVTVDDKTLRIVADTSEAMDALKNVEGIHIDPKTLVITADNAEALEKAKAINGVTVDDKTLRIVADTSEAMQHVQQLTSSIENQEVVIRPTVAFAKELPSLPTLVPKIEMPKMPDIKPLKMQIKAELDAQALKVDEQTLKTILQDSIQNGINGMDLQFASLNEQIAQGIDVPEEKWHKILDDYNKLREAIGKDPISIDFSTGNAKKDEERKGESDFDKGLGDMSKVVSGLSSVASGLQQMGIELPEGVQKTLGVIQGLMSVIQGVNTIISVFSTTSETANTAAVTGNTFAMTALTAAVAANTAALGTNTVTNFIPLFAHGGLVHAATGYMVPGNDHADRTLIAASSGELILNRAQQGVIAGALEGGAGRSVHVTGHLEGETIVLAADRYGRRTGKGELAFWK